MDACNDRFSQTNVGERVWLWLADSILNEKNSDQSEKSWPVRVPGRVHADVCNGTLRILINDLSVSIIECQQQVS
jgi:hypothetical protein